MTWKPLDFPTAEGVKMKPLSERIEIEKAFLEGD